MANTPQVKGSRNTTLGVTAFGFFMGISGIALFGPTAAQLREPMELSATQVGWLVAMPALSGALIRVVFGAWADATGGKKPFLSLLGIMLAAMAVLVWILFAYYPDDLGPQFYPVLLLLGAVIGFGVDTFSVGIPMNAYWNPMRRQGTALGIFAGFGNAGAGAFTLFVPFLVAALTLPGAYLFWIIIVGIAFTLVALFAQNAPYFQLHQRDGLPRDEAEELARGYGQEAFPRESLWPALFEAARAWRNWALVMTYFVSFGGFLALTAWLPTYWYDFHGMSATAAGALAAAFGIWTGLVRVPGGALADTLGGEPTNFLAFGLALVGSLVLVFAGTAGPAFVGTMLIATGFGIANAAQFSLVPVYLPRAIGGAAGWIGGLGGFGGTLFPPLLGVFVDAQGTQGYATGFLVFAVLSVASIAIMILLRATRGGVTAAVAAADARAARKGMAVPDTQPDEVADLAPTREKTA